MPLIWPQQHATGAGLALSLAGVALALTLTWPPLNLNEGLVRVKRGKQVQ